jgi:hypothetical protein
VDLRARARDDETPTGFHSEKVSQLRRQVGQGLKEVIADARNETEPCLSPPLVHIYSKFGPDTNDDVLRSAQSVRVSNASGVA